MQSLKVKHSGGPLDNQTWQTEWKTAPLAKVQLCEHENQTLEAFAATSCLSVKFDCLVACQKFSFSFLLSEVPLEPSPLPLCGSIIFEG